MEADSPESIDESGAGFSLARFPGSLLALALAAGLALRWWMLKQYFEVNGDALIYGEWPKTCCCTAAMRSSRPAERCSRR